MFRSHHCAPVTFLLATLSLVPLLGLSCPANDPLGGSDNSGAGDLDPNGGNSGNPNLNFNLVPVIDQTGPIALTVQRNSTCGGGGNQFTLAASDGDGPASALTWYVRIAPQHGAATFVGALQGATAIVCYTPEAAQSEDDGFSIGVYDGKGDIAFVDFTVVVQNSGPDIITPVSTTLVVNQNSNCSAPANRITISATDPDGAGAELEWLVDGGPTTGVVTLPGGKFGGAVAFCYSPNPNQIAADGFTVQVRDEEGLADTIQVNVTVVNTPPSIVNGGEPQDLLVWKNSPCGSPFNAVTITADDPDADEAFLNWSIQTPPGQGTASIVGPSSGGSINVCYEPAQDQSDATSFVMRVGDGTGGTASVAVSVEIDTPPQGGLYEGNTSQGQQFRFQMVDGGEPKVTAYDIHVDVCPDQEACCLGTFAFGCWDIPCDPNDPILIAPSGTFSAGVLPAAINGSFDASGNASGTAQVQISTSNPNCPPNPVVTDVTWTAARTGP